MKWRQLTTPKWRLATDLATRSLSTAAFSSIPLESGEAAAPAGALGKAFGSGGGAFA